MLVPSEIFDGPDTVHLKSKVVRMGTKSRDNGLASAGARQGAGEDGVALTYIQGEKRGWDGEYFFINLF